MVGELIDDRVDGVERAVVPEDDGVVGLKMPNGRVIVDVLPVEEADGDGVVVRHVGRGVDVGARVANHDERGALGMLAEERGGGAIRCVLGERSDRWIRCDGLRRGVGAIIQPVRANRDVFGEGIVLPQKLLNHVRQPRGDDEHGHFECCQTGKQLEGSGAWFHLGLAHHAWDEVARRLAVLDHELVCPVPPACHKVVDMGQSVAALCERRPTRAA
mmetsp:Transcript_1264/g.4077  ORF Transcript_1264/g.4077 Transcript_1264/m.4077 type:complete len:216 (+) Transcript_1264:484-1131(+)